MHLLEADVSANSLPWFMDPEASRKSGNDPDMIQTSSRIDSSLPSRIGDHSVRGKSFSSPTPRVYSKMGIGLNEIHHRPFSPTENSRLRNTGPEIKQENPEQEYEERMLNPQRCREEDSDLPENNLRHTDDTMYPARSVRPREIPSPREYVNGHGSETKAGTHRSPHKRDMTKQRPNSDPASNAEVRKVKNVLNKNGNNNIQLNASAADGRPFYNHLPNGAHRKSPDAEHRDCEKYSHGEPLAHLPSKSAQYYNYSPAIPDEKQEESLNGSDILKRMYASFGPNRQREGEKLPTTQSTKPHPTPPLRKRKYCPRDFHDGGQAKYESAERKDNRIQQLPQNSDVSHDQKRRKMGEMEHETKTHLPHSPPLRAEPQSHDRRSPNSNARGDTDHARGVSYHDLTQPSTNSTFSGENSDFSSTKRRPTIELPKASSPSHFAECPFPKHSSDDAVNGHDDLYKRHVCRREDERPQSPQAASPRGKGTQVHRSPDKCDKPLIDRNTEEQMARLKYTDANGRSPKRTPPRESKPLPEHDDSRDAYNDTSREIFLREKELIENSLRQNGLPVGMQADPGVFQSPYFLDPHALAAFQSGLLASNAASMMHDPNAMLKSASMAAAASANPFMLGLGQYFANPYLLRGLIANGLPTAAYTQAMTQGFLTQQQSIMPFLNAVPAAHSVYPGPSSMYGHMSMRDSEPITAAIAASLRQNVAAYQTAAPPYPFLSNPVAQQMQQTQVDEMTRDSRNTLAKHHYLDERHPKLTPQINKSNHEIKRGPTRISMQPDASTDANRRRNSNESTRTTHGSSRIRSQEEGRRVSKDLPSAFSLHPHPVKEAQHYSKNSSITKCPKLPASPPHIPAQLPRHGLKLKRKPLPVACERPRPERRSYSPDQGEAEYARELNSEISPNLLLETLEKGTIQDMKQDSSLIKNQAINNKISRPSSYKNLTRERRLVANARERTRVHTISSAFEELRHQIPSYSCNQKLSKLAILRIACSYIQSLSVLAGRNTEDDFSDSVDQCTRVLQAESRARSRRKSNKAQIEWEVANYEKTPAFGGDFHGKRDSQRQSLENPPPITHDASQKSPTNEPVPQVHDESPRRKPTESSSAEPRTSRGEHALQATRHGVPNRYSDQYQGDVFLEKHQPAIDSLDTTATHTKRLHVNDTKDVNSAVNHAPKATRDPTAADSTWRAGVSPKTAVKGVESPAKPEHDLPDGIPCQTVRPERNGGTSKEYAVDDQQNEVINVED